MNPLGPTNYRLSALLSQPFKSSPPLSLLEWFGHILPKNPEPIRKLTEVIRKSSGWVPEVLVTEIMTSGSYPEGIRKESGSRIVSGRVKNVRKPDRIRKSGSRISSGRVKNVRQAPDTFRIPSGWGRRSPGIICSHNNYTHTHTHTRIPHRVQTVPLLLWKSAGNPASNTVSYNVS